MTDPTELTMRLRCNGDRASHGTLSMCFTSYRQCGTRHVHRQKDRAHTRLLSQAEANGPLMQGGIFGEQAPY